MESKERNQTQNTASETSDTVENGPLCTLQGSTDSTFIDKLPFELLSLSIFSLYCTSLDPKIASANLSDQEDAIYTPQLHGSQVCSYCRYIALRTTELWADLSVDIPTEEDRSHHIMWLANVALLPHFPSRLLPPASPTSSPN